MSYSVMCSAATAFNVGANISLSYANRFNSEISLQGGALFGVIAGVTYTIIAGGTFKAANLLAPVYLRVDDRSKEIRDFFLSAASIATSTIVTSLFTPNFASCIGLQVSYKTGIAYSFFNVATTLFIGTILANLPKKRNDFEPL